MGYRNLKIIDKGIDFVVLLYKMTESFPVREMYGLTSQMRRASVSIVSNISEGSLKTDKDFIRYLYIARGSVSELSTQIKIAYRLGYLDKQQYATLDNENTLIGKSIYSLIKNISL